MDMFAVAKLQSPAAGVVAAAVPRMLKAVSPTTPVEERALALYRERNGILDRIFYNVEPEDEARVIALDHEQGSIILVDPDPAKDLRYFHDPVEFLQDGAADEVGAISIAGVGSSPIGAVGLARDVATVKKVPVAGIVSGYGVDDVVYEGLGGWICLRETNRLEFMAQRVTNSVAMLAGLPPLETAISLMDSIGSGPDLFTLKCLLRSRRPRKLGWLVGHSKGNLLIASAIAELVMEGADLQARLADVRIVLFSALSALPEGIGRPHQIIGTIDMLGWINSRLHVPCKLVQGAMHHLNPTIPFALLAREELGLIM
jgi:hypothetical protein